MKTIRIQINATALPQTVELDLPHGFFVTGVTVLPIQLSEVSNSDDVEDDDAASGDDVGVVPTVQWYDHELKTKVLYENTKSYLTIYGPPGAEVSSNC